MTIAVRIFEFVFVNYSYIVFHRHKVYMAVSECNSNTERTWYPIRLCALCSCNRLSKCYVSGLRSSREMNVCVSYAVILLWLFLSTDCIIAYYRFG
jgi:hypothetical protein